MPVDDTTMSIVTTALVHRTYEPFIPTHGDGTDPWFVLWANHLITMNKENRHRIVFLQSMLSYAAVTLLVCLAGIASGLTLALFTLDPDKLKTLAATGRGKRCDQARRVLPHLANPHWTLVTLLVINAFAAETMPLILSRLYGGLIAVILSVVLMLFFGEIFPQAIFTKYALPICSFFAPLIAFFKYLTAPISWPVGLLLDKLIGHRQKRFMRRLELQQLIRLHQTEEKAKRHEERDAAIIDATISNLQPHDMLDSTMAMTTTNAMGSFRAKPSVGKQGRKGVKPGPRPNRFTTPMSQDSDDDTSSSSSSDSDQLEELEVRIMIGALSMSELKVKQIIKMPIDTLFCIAADRKIDKEVVERVYISGYSRVLVLDEDELKFIGYFLSRDLVAYAYKSEADAPLARDLHLHQPIYCSGDETVGTLYTTLCLMSTPVVLVTDAPPFAHDVSGCGTGGDLNCTMSRSEAAKGYKPIGLVTFEDVFETVQGTSIADETDRDNDKAIQLKSKLSAAMTIRRHNQRMTEVLTKGMLRHELTQDLFSITSPVERTPVVAKGNLTSREGDDMECAELTARSGLLRKNASMHNLTSYGSTGPAATASRGTRSRGASQFGQSPRLTQASLNGSFFLGTGMGTPPPTALAPGAVHRVGSDTFLSPRLRATVRFPTPERGASPERRNDTKYM